MLENLSSFDIPFLLPPPVGVLTSPCLSSQTGHLLISVNSSIIPLLPAQLTCTEGRANKRDSRKMGKADRADLSLKHVHLEMCIDMNALNHFLCLLILILFRFSVRNLGCDSGSFVLFCFFPPTLGSIVTDTSY